MSRMKEPGPSKVSFKIEHDRPEDSPNSLAIRLVEAFQAAANSQADADALRFSAQSERTKAQQIQDAIFQLKERKKNPPAKVSRMDPLNEYSLEACETQLAELKKNSVELQKTSDEHAQEAMRQRNEAERLQRLIREANDKARIKDQ